VPWDNTQGTIGRLPPVEAAALAVCDLWALGPA
jgi:hypothetical protein